MNEQERLELVHYRIAKAKETLNEVQLHIQNQLWNTAVNRLYYACYYAVIALLIKNKIEAITHSGTRQMFGLHFVKPGLIHKELGEYYSAIFDMRQTGDYEDFMDFSEGDVIKLVRPASELILTIEKML